MDIVLFDTPARNFLYPFTLTRPVADIRIGVFTIRQFWEQHFNAKTFTVTENYLQEKFPSATAQEVLLINAALVPTEEFFTELVNLGNSEVLMQDEIVLAGKTTLFKQWEMKDINASNFLTVKKLKQPLDFLTYPWQLFQWNDNALRSGFAIITKGKTSAAISSTNKYINPENIFIEEGARVQCSILNGSTGPIYIGKNCEVMEGCSIRGPFAMLDGSVLKMGAKVYGATTLGPGCMAGGEIKNSILFAYSNKAHDGYLGDSVIGEWCNLGAGTSNSNLKNNAGEVKVWTKAQADYLPVGLKCGLIMGDYSRSAINTSFNTGTVTGICCNIFGEGLMPKYIPDFCWGHKGEKGYDLNKALRDINNWKQLKNELITEPEKNILKHIFEQL
jgi:UDP-N-acetylglucosamine diphosphorylase / glucose-1-phosphate thymidylyltransferase / UDP-N-acetylgalactosamine diphosphorylase / glucosamine-1-phosphate N-acetyltransferase / galactosamine-1-phosphate N-acetyltransferase